MIKNKRKGWRRESTRHKLAAKGIKTGRKRYKTRRYYNYKSLDNLLRKNYGSFPIIKERLGKRKREALMTKKDVTQFFRDYPEYRLQTEGLKKIEILADREPSMKIQSRAEFDPGLYLTKEKEIRLFPIKPKVIPPEMEERAKKFYFSKEQFPAALVHELKHHSIIPKELKEVTKLSDEEIINLPIAKQERLKKIIKEQEEFAEKTEDIWLKKMRRRKQR